MNTIRMVPTILAALLPATWPAAALPAQQTEPPAADQGGAATAAEQQFRDAWWAESGRNDLDAALRGYLAAAIAEGPASVRAKALLHAGRVQQRLGKGDAALATFRKVITDYALEREIVAQAREHLRELTAIDLRQDYDEWYERRLFGEEVQLVILGKLEALAQKLGERPKEREQQQTHQAELSQLQGEILAFGRGAVPALRKTCDSGNTALRERAVGMLFELGELPPVPALAACDEWTRDSSCWQRVLAAAGTGVAVPESQHWTLPLLVAALAGPEQLTTALLQSTDPRLLDALDVATAITVALLRHDQGRAAMLAAMKAPATPLRLRPALEEALGGDDETRLPLSAQQWLDVSQEPLRYALRVQGVTRAAALLQPRDGEQLEAILARIEAAPRYFRPEFARALAQGLSRLLAPQQVPWTLSRLRRALVVASTYDGDCVLGPAAFALRRQQDTRALLAEAAFGNPAGLLAAVREAEGFPAMLGGTMSYDESGEGFDVALMDMRWQQAVLAVLQQQWQKWPDAERTAALELLPLTLRSESDHGPVITFLKQAREDASDQVRDAIDALLATLGG